MEVGWLPNNFTSEFAAVFVRRWKGMCYEMFFLSPLSFLIPFVFPIVNTSNFTSGKIFSVILVEMRKLSGLAFWAATATWGGWDPELGRSGSGSR